jgi:1-acyl-sn-glycerol-3-phosphate acyltransferase
MAGGCAWPDSWFPLSCDATMVWILERNVLGQNIPLKKVIMSAATAGFYPMFRWRHRLTVKGAERLKALPRNGILFVSNHQTYFTDGICMHLIFSAMRSGYDHPADGVLHLLEPLVSFYFVAATETMTSGVLPRMLARGGAVCVKRSWKEGERVIERDVDVEGFNNVGRAIQDGWVVTFPQGTTRPFAPGRMGTAHLIRTFKPIVVPVVLDGFNEAF